MSIKYYEVSLDEVAERLRSILEGMPEVRVAVLFGSATRRRLVRDVDVGVCLDSGDGLRSLIRIANILEDAIGVPVDVVPLRSAPPRLRLKALLKGVKLVVRDENLYASLLSEALSEAVDMGLKLRGEGGFEKG